MEHLKQMQAEPFNAFDVHPISLAVYQLGNNGTARTLLKVWPRLPSRELRHVGSAAVRGLVAVEDLKGRVPDVGDEQSIGRGLESLGLVLRAREPATASSRPPAGHPRTLHVHV